MKKITALMIISVLILSLTSCQKSISDDKEIATIDRFTEADDIVENSNKPTVADKETIVEIEEKPIEPNAPSDKDPDADVTNESETETQTDVKPESEEQPLIVGEEERDTVDQIVQWTEPCYFCNIRLNKAIAKSSLIILSETARLNRVIRVQDGDKKCNFLEYTVDVKEVFRGQLEENRITLRIQGGALGGENSGNSHFVNLNNDDMHVLFLYKPTLYNDYYTNDNYYEMTDLIYGAFKIPYDSDNIYCFDSVNDYTVMLEYTEECLNTLMCYLGFTLEDLRTVMSHINADMPYDPDYEKNALLEKYYDSNKQDIDILNRFTNNREYATIIEERVY